VSGEIKAAVLLATFNGGKYVTELLESMASQTFKNFVLFVRDDGSSDNTISLVRRFSKRMSMNILEAQSRVGPAKSFFELLSGAGADFDLYCFADQDDVWAGSKIERAAQKLSQFKNRPAMYCSRLEYVDEQLKHIRYSRPPRIISFENALVENIATGCTVAINSKSRNLLLRTPPEAVYMHDWWFYVFHAAIGEVLYDDFPAIQYRQHSANAVGAETGIVSTCRKRFKRFIQRDSDGIFRVSRQALSFKSCFAGLLNQHQTATIDLLLNKKTLPTRLRLALCSPFVRQRELDTFILRILFLLGRY